MAYKSTLTTNKRAQLMKQMDDFATFQWRGHNMFNDFGCFIINDKNGSLKFYNGPSFSNQYATPQFSKNVSGLLGIDFKQQTLSMKVGLYWFTIAEYQEFLNCISPYAIDYLTFDFASDYSYLVKLGKIADSPRHIVGKNGDGEYVYYTEMELTWELLGDNCVRSTSPYEYEAELNTNTITWSLSTNSDQQDPSLLDTPVLFELPLSFTSETADLQLQAQYSDSSFIDLFKIKLENLVLDNGSDISSTTTSFPVGDYDLLHTLSTSLVTTGYRVNGKTLQVPSNNYTGKILSANNNGYTTTDWSLNIVASYEKLSYSIYPNSFGFKIVLKSSDFFTKNNILETLTFDGKTISLSQTDEWGSLAEALINGYWLKYNASSRTLECYQRKNNNCDFTFQHKIWENKTTVEGIPTDKFTQVSFNYDGADYSQMAVFETSGGGKQLVFIKENSYVVPSLPATITLKGEYPTSNVANVLNTTNFNPQNSDISYKTKIVNDYTMFLRYDSETGLIYIQEGNNDTWRLLNYQTDNYQGNYMLNSAWVSKWKAPGKFSQPDKVTTNWSFRLTGNNIKWPNSNSPELKTAITMYSRKNIV